MNTGTTFLKIQWDCLNQKKIKKTPFTIGVGFLFVGISLLVARHFSPVDFSIPLSPARPCIDRLLGYAGACFGGSIVCFYVYFKSPKSARQLLKNKNTYSIELKDDFLIYTENLIDTDIYYKN